MSAMNLFMDSCKGAAEYPKNLVDHHHTYKHHIRGYRERLDKQESLLFCDEGKGALDIWEIEDGVNGVFVPSLLTHPLTSMQGFARLVHATQKRWGTSFAPHFHLYAVIRGVDSCKQFHKLSP
jgi:hypothetical protein